MTKATLSISLRTFSPDDPGGWGHVVARARAAEAAGIDRVVVSDHVVFGEHLEAYGRPELGGIANGRQPTGPDGHWLEPLTSLAVIAGATSDHPARHRSPPRRAASPGGAGQDARRRSTCSPAGGSTSASASVGSARSTRRAASTSASAGRLLDRTLEVCQQLWRQERASYDSADLTFDAIHMMPKPRDAGRRPDLGQRHAQRPRRARASPASAAGGSRGATMPPTSRRRSRRCATRSPRGGGAGRHRGRGDAPGRET